MRYFVFLCDNLISGSTIVTSALELLGGLGAFLIAVKLISDAMNQLTNAGLKKLFVSLDNRKFAGVGLGALTSAVLHSSAVTTVMVVGFVNAGIMALSQAVTIIMGANIGTTFTALLAGLGTSFDFLTYATVLSFAGILLASLGKKETVKNIGYMIAGLGLIFVSLQFMKSAVKPVTDQPEVIGDLFVHANPFVMLLLGIVLTFVLQSSTALTTILISMAGVFCDSGNGGITNSVLFVILGSNIGTCFTTIIASLGANANAKRAGLIHLLFNLFGSIMFFVFLSVWKDFAQDTLARWFVGAPSLQIAVFHTIFNTFCTLVFLPFSNLFVKVANAILPNNADDQSRKIIYIDDRFLATPSIAVQQAKLEARHIGDFVMKTCDIAMDAFMKTDASAENIIAENLVEMGDLNKRLVQYLVSISASSGTTAHSEGTISGLYYVLGDLLRVGDLSHNITKYTRRVANGEVVFSQRVYVEVKSMYDKVRAMYDEAMDCFINKDIKLLKVVQQHEDEIDEIRKTLVNQHIERLNNGECNPASNGVFINLVGNIERMADHITFIAESITKHPDSIKVDNK